MNLGTYCLDSALPLGQFWRHCIFLRYISSCCLYIPTLMTELNETKENLKRIMTELNETKENKRKSCRTTHFLGGEI